MGGVSATSEVVYPSRSRRSARMMSLFSSLCQPRNGNVYRPVKRAIRTGRVGSPSA